MPAYRHLRIIPAAVAFFIVTGCDHTHKEWKTPNMTPLTPRLQALFQKTKTVCFGRFMLDVPSSTTVAWGETDVSLGISIFPNGVDKVHDLARKFVDELKSEKAINHGDVPLLLSIDDVAQPSGRIIVGYEDFQSINGLKIKGYFSLNNDGIFIDARPLREDQDETVALIKSIARRLQTRAETDIPIEPGNCIAHAFLPDDPAAKEKPVELIRIGFRLKEFPDTHLSIFVGPSNPNYTDSSSLEWRLERLEKNQRAQDPNNPLLKTKMLRRGPRQIHDWLNGGFEALSHSPELAEVHGIHDFAMDFRGVPSDPLKPYAEIQMQTGVADNLAGAIKPSLTDEEAIAVWDKITSTIRVRPTSGTAVKTSQADSPPRRPLGELAATGRVCPQAGWWQPSEPYGKEGGGRQHFQAGQQMPHVVLAGEPSIWQKLRGEQPSYRRATVWQLVEYGEAPPALAQAAATDTASNDARNGSAQGGGHDEDPAKKG